MHPNDLKEFRDNVAMPRMMQLFANTEIPDGACYIDNLEFGFLDGRSCGVDSHILASGLVYRDGRAEKYVYDEYDVDFNSFFLAHKDCVFISDGKLRINDDLDEMELNTRIRNIEACKKFFPWFDISSEIKYEMSSIQYEKAKYLFENGNLSSQNEINESFSSLDSKIDNAKAQQKEAEISFGTKEIENSL